MMRRVLLMLPLVISISNAWAGEVTATGYGSTAPEATREAAINAIRKEAGSYLSVEEELSVSASGSSSWAESIKESSKGVVSAFEVLEIKQVAQGEYRATVRAYISDTDEHAAEPGENIGGNIAIGRLAGASAEARLHADAPGQVSDALRDYAAAKAKQIEVLGVAQERDPNAIASMAERSRSIRIAVPLRLTVRVAVDDAARLTLLNTLRAIAPEQPFSKAFSLGSKQNGNPSYACVPADVGSMSSITVFKAKHAPEVISNRPGRSQGYIFCNGIGRSYSAEIMGAPEALFNINGPLIRPELDPPCQFAILLQLADGTIEQRYVDWDPNNYPSISGNGVIADFANPRPLPGLLGSFSPATLIGSYRDGQIYALPSVNLVFSLMIAADTAEQLISIRVMLTK